jgi:DedD protein
VKERLTGAIIIVALMVLLVPALLSGPIRSAPRAASVTEGAQVRTVTINIADETPARGSAAGNGPPQPGPLTATPDPQVPGAAAAPPQEAAPPAVPAPAAPAAPPAPVAAHAPGGAASAHAGNTSVAGAFVVQLGSFSSRTNADRLAHQLRAQGFEVNVSQGSAGRHLYRVRTAGLDNHAAATALAQQLRAAGHSGAVVPQ